MARRKKVNKADAFNSIVGRINSMLPSTRQTYMTYERGKYTFKQVGATGSILSDLTETETHYAVHGFYEGVKACKGKSKS